MKSRIVFGRWESIAMLLNSICMQIFLNFPRVMAESAATAGWLLVIYISLLALAGFALIAKLYDRFGGKDILDIAEYAGGNPVRIVTGVIIIVHIITVISLTLREFGEDMKVIALVTSPISFVEFFFLVGMVVGAFLGLEAIVRLHAVVIPIVIAGYTTIILGVFPYSDLNNLLPILGTGWKEILLHSSSRVSTYSALILLYLITPFLRTNKNLRTVGLWVVGLACFFLTSSVVVFLSVMPFPIAVESFLPIYHLARLISFGRFFQRIESLFVHIWAVSALLYLSTGFFFMLHVFRKTFNLEYYKPLVIPFAILVFNISLLPESLMETIHFEGVYFRNFSWMVTFGLVIVILLMANMKKSRKIREEKGNV